MVEVIDFYAAKNKIKSEEKQDELQEKFIAESMKSFQEFCTEWKRKYAELSRDEFILIKNKGEIL